MSTSEIKPIRSQSDSDNRDRDAAGMGIDLKTRMLRSIFRAGRSAVCATFLLIAVGCSQQAKPDIAHSSKKETNEPAPAPAFSEFAAKAEVRARLEVNAPSNLRFVDRAAERGLNYVLPDQPRPMTGYEAFGTGCAVFDSDNDGWQDILLIDRPFPAFFRNQGAGRFKDVTEDSGLKEVSGKWVGAAIADYDGDGRLDVLLTGHRQLALFQNIDGTHFRDVTTTAGLDPKNGNLWGTSAGFMDLDGDTWLDLVIINYFVDGPDDKKYCEYKHGIISGCGPRTEFPEFPEIWRNTGHQSFELVPKDSGMKSSHGIGMVLAFTDLDEDGQMDFYIGNDGVPADLMLNRGHFQFDNIAQVAGVSTSDNGRPISAMGADWSDFDRDGRLDLIVTNWFDLSSALFLNLGDRLFADYAKKTDLARLTRDRLGFGAKWVDFENDGWPDIFMVNGHVNHNSADIYGPGCRYREPMLLLWNSRGQRVVDIVPQLGDDVQRAIVGRGCATGDFDNDGRVDLLAVDLEGPALLLMNETESPNHWIKLDLRGQSPNSFAYGTRVTATSSEQIWVAEVSPASSFLSSSDPRIHWGTGDNTSLEKLTIRWPSGVVQTMENVSVDRILRIDAPAPSSTSVEH